MAAPGPELARLEAIIDTSAVAGHIEALLPRGVRPRQLSVSTLLIGILLCLADHRPAHLVRVHEALLALPEQEQRRLGVIARCKDGEHELSYRQVERTFGLVVGALAKQAPDGSPSQALSEVMDRLLEASVSVAGAARSRALAVDWTDYESFARPPRKSRAAQAGDEQPAAEDAEPAVHDGEPDAPPGGAEGQAPHGQRRCADEEASWGHRRGDGPGQRDEAFFGYYLQAATMVREEGSAEVPELTRRVLLTSCHIDPPGAFVAVIERMAAAGIALGDVLADCGYSYRGAPTWALPLRMMGAGLVQDIHPNDRGQKGTHMGAVIANGSLYCPATPKALLELGPLAPGAGAEQAATHDQRSEELKRYKLPPISARDSDGYHRVLCPAQAGKLRCPLRQASMALSYEHPTVTEVPCHPPVCCTQQTITVPASVNAKTAGKHDYPSKAHRDSYARRSAAERTFSHVKDPAANDISAKGWCRLAGLTGPSLFLACVFVVQNVRVADAFAARVAEDARRAGCGLAPRRRRRRQRTIHDLLAGANARPG